MVFLNACTTISFGIRGWMVGMRCCSYLLSEGTFCLYSGYRIPERVEPDNESYGVGAERID